MKISQVRLLGKEFLPQMPGYTHKGMMLYASSLNHILKGFYFEGSDFDPSAFYVWTFFLPLYVPAMHVSFSFGKRLGGGSGKRWNLNDPQFRDELFTCIKRYGLPFLEGVERPNDIPMAIHRLGAEDDPYNLEAIAYSLAMAGNFAAALHELERLTKALDKGVSWQAEMLERATQLARKLSDDPQEAARQLAEWEQTTVKNLGLG